MVFDDNLRLEDIDDKPFCFRLLEEFSYSSEDFEKRFVVPAGFVTDFASVPRFFWRIAPPHGRAKRAAVVHDHLYTTQIVTRLEADKVFLFGMRDMGMPAWRRYGMYYAVRLAGWRAWNRYSREL